jgi:hypothetical protein
LPTGREQATHLSMEAIFIVVMALLVGARLIWVRVQARRRARRVYQDALTRALDDGILTEDEAGELEQLRLERNLTSAEVRMAAVALYRRALQDASADHQLTTAESERLDALQHELGLTEQDLRSDLTHLRRLRTLAAAAEGVLPTVECPIDLVTGETCHWIVHGTLAQVLGLPTGASGALAGVSMPVLDTEPFHARGERTLLRPSERILPFDLGAVIITSRRTVFQGAKRSVSVPHARLRNVVLFADGVGLEETAGTLRFFLVDDPELTASILLYAARARRLEIRPTRTDRSA